MKHVFDIVAGLCLMVDGKSPGSRIRGVSDAFIRSRSTGALNSRVLDLSHGQPLPELSLADDSEYVCLKKGVETVHASPNWKRSEFWVVGTFQDFDSFEIKYRINCDNPTGVHPLLRDFVLRETLGGTYAVQRVLYITGARELGDSLLTWNSRKISFLMSAPLLRSCVETGGTALRYLVSEAASDNVLDRVNRFFASGNSISFAVGMDFLKLMITQLNELHARGIIHGNINPKNIVKVSDGDRLVLTNFDYGFFEDEIEADPPAPRRDLCFDSHWRLSGHQRGFRDDLMGVMLVAAFVIHGPAFIHNCNAMSQDELISFKSEGRLFSLPQAGIVQAPWVRDDTSYFRDPESGGLHWEKKSLIDDHLERIMRRVRCLVHPSSFPDYAAIHEHISAIQSILRR